MLTQATTRLGAAGLAALEPLGDHAGPGRHVADGVGGLERVREWIERRGRVGGDNGIRPAGRPAQGQRRLERLGSGAERGRRSRARRDRRRSSIGCRPGSRSRSGWDGPGRRRGRRSSTWKASGRPRRSRSRRLGPPSTPGPSGSVPAPAQPDLGGREQNRGLRRCAGRPGRPATERARRVETAHGISTGVGRDRADWPAEGAGAGWPCRPRRSAQPACRSPGWLRRRRSCDDAVAYPTNLERGSHRLIESTPAWVWEVFPARSGIRPRSPRSP